MDNAPTDEIENEAKAQTIQKLASVIGKKFYDCKNEEVKNNDEIFYCRLIGLFFTATWCSPCRIFEKDLLDVYTEGNQGEKVFEIIQVSLEKEEDVNKKFIFSRPWRYLAVNDPKNSELKDKFEVLTIPKFIVLRNDGTILTSNGRSEINEGGTSVTDKWLKMLEN